MPPAILWLGPEALCFCVVRPSVRAYVRADWSTLRPVCGRLLWFTYFFVCKRFVSPLCEIIEHVRRTSIKMWPATDADVEHSVYRRCLRSMWSRVYVTVGRPSVRPSVSPIGRRQQRRPAGLLLSVLTVGSRYPSIAEGALRAPYCGRRRPAANATQHRLVSSDIHVHRPTIIGTYQNYTACTTASMCRRNPPDS